MKACPPKDQYLGVHSRMIHNKQKVETVQIAMDKQNMLYPCSILLFSTKKKGTPVCAAIQKNLSTHYAKRGDTRHRDYILYTFIYRECPKKQTYRDRQRSNGGLGQEWGWVRAVINSSQAQ